MSRYCCATSSDSTTALLVNIHVALSLPATVDLDHGWKRILGDQLILPLHRHI
jgi:hypothetical protein